MLMFKQLTDKDTIYSMRGSRKFHLDSIKNVSEYDQEIPQSHTVDQPTAPLGKATEHLQ